ncbi:MAG: hypothetical protein NC307_10795 [Roseburia sp.]|nr:hypothetical protein [Roseburia sp.]
MDYFIMKTDRRIRKLPQIQMPKEFSGMGTRRTSVAYVNKHNGVNIEYADYLEKPFPLIADKFQKVLQKYQQDIKFWRVMLVEQETGLQRPYCVMHLPQVICADKEESRYDDRGEIKEFVLDAEKAEGRRIFLAEDYNQQLLVRLDAAESILRREANGIWFEPVKISERSRSYVRSTK